MFDKAELLKKRNKILQQRATKQGREIDRLNKKLEKQKYANNGIILDWVNSIRHRLNVDEYTKIKNILTS